MPEYLAGYPFAVGAVVALTIALLPFRGLIEPAQAAVVYVLVVVAVARLAGIGPALTATGVAVLALDIALVPPYFAPGPLLRTDAATLAIFLFVSVVVAWQAGMMLRRERAALQRQRELALLNRLASRLVSADPVDAVAVFIVEQVVAVLGSDRAALYEADTGGSARLAAEAGGASSGLAEAALADWVLDNEAAVGLPDAVTAALEDACDVAAAGAAVPGVVADGAYLPLRSVEGIEGVLYVRSLRGAEPTAENVRQLLAVANLAAAFLQRRRLEDETTRASALAESDRLKATLVSSVSHELKTPLAAVTARVTGLLAEGGDCSAVRVRHELEAVSDDLGRLNASIGDLLDVSRLESDAWRPRFDVYDIGEVLGTVQARVPSTQRARVSFCVPEGLPPVRLDFSQTARALSNLVDNALNYTPAGELVSVGARRLGDEVLVWVEDHGPGVPDAEKEAVFGKFYRGTTSGVAPSGTGLGLAIAREIARSHGGRVWVEDVQPHGARFVLSLPLEGVAG